MILLVSVHLILPMHTQPVEPRQIDSLVQTANQREIALGKLDHLL
jgi:hypothetical protein